MLKKGDNVICKKTQLIGVIISDKTDEGTYSISTIDGTLFCRKETEVEKMRSFTKDEQDEYNKSLDTLFEPTGINLFDL